MLKDPGKGKAVYMAKKTVKTEKNLYFQKREELNLTREAAAELLEAITPDRLEKIENERTAAHPEEILLMAKKYNAPNLCNYYCSHDCPIGVRYVPEIQEKDLSQIILETIASLNIMNKKQERFIEIGADGVVDDEEMQDFLSIRNELEKISIAIETLQFWYEGMICKAEANQKNDPGSSKGE